MTLSYIGACWLLAGCPGKPAPLVPMPLAPADPAAAAAWARATLPGRDTAIRFRWKYQDADRRWGGRGRGGGRRERCSPAAPRSSTGAACRRAPDSTSRRARPVLSSRWLRWTPRRSSIRRCGAAAGSASGLALAACLYGFAGGGLPNIKTVAILPFDNQTPEPALTKEVNDAVLEAFQGRLGLRPAAPGPERRELDRVSLLVVDLRGRAVLRGQHRRGVLPVLPPAR